MATVKKKTVPKKQTVSKSTPKAKKPAVPAKKTVAAANQKPIAKPKATGAKVAKKGK